MVESGMDVDGEVRMMGTIARTYRGGEGWCSGRGRGGSLRSLQRIDRRDKVGARVVMVPRQARCSSYCEAWQALLRPGLAVSQTSLQVGSLGTASLSLLLHVTWKLATGSRHRPLARSMRSVIGPC